MDDSPQYLMIRSDELLRRDAEIDRLRAELAEAQKAVEIALSERVNLRAAMNNEIYRLSAELAEARRALLAGNDTVLANKKLQERIAHERVEGDKISAALEMANARIAELDAHMANEYARCEAWKARAERAEAECKALRETVRKIRATDNITAVWHIADAALDRAVKAEAELKVTREALEQIVKVYCTLSNCWLCRTARAALAPSRAGREG